VVFVCGLLYPSPHGGAIRPSYDRCNSIACTPTDGVRRHRKSKKRRPTGPPANSFRGWNVLKNSPIRRFRKLAFLTTKGQPRHCTKVVGSSLPTTETGSHDFDYPPGNQQTAGVPG